MVGSAGGLGVLVELSMKVMPRPEAYATLLLDVPSLAAALGSLSRLGALPIDLDALDIAVLPTGARLLVRVGGSEAAIPARIDRLRDALGGGEVISGSDEDGPWHDAREFAWVPAGWSLVKVPVTPGRIAALDASLVAGQALRRYVARGQLAWIASPGPADGLDEPLTALGLSGLAVLGPSDRRRLGVRVGATFERRVKQALDPQGRFVEA
jgi:glycolate oxidase FAD binding subunit